MIKIKDYKNKIDQSNLGFMFIYFDGNNDASLFKKFIAQFKKSNDCPKLANVAHVNSWKIKDSPGPSNIIWESYNKKHPFDYLLDFLLGILLFFLTILLSSPLNSAEFISKGMSKLFGEDSQAYNLGISMVPPLAMALFNSFFIPTIVYEITERQFFETKSEKEKSKTQKYFFYLLLISFIMPLLGLNELR